MAKRIAIATLGTQGDVQPYVALAAALQARGYSVVVGAPADFTDMVRSRDLEFWDLSGNIQEFLTQSRFESMMSQNMLINAPALLREGQKIVDTAARRFWEMAQGADALVLNMNTSFGIDIAEGLDIPAVMAALQPLNTTSEFPLCAFYGPTFGRTFNKLSYTAVSVQQIYYDLPRNRLRRELMGLDPRKKGGFFKNSDGRDLTILYAYSEHVAPRPSDWPGNAKITGYWMLEDNTGWEPSERFRKFLSEGEPPIYVGFGSMPFGAQRNTEVLREAAAKWGGRIVVARGWGGINPADLPENVFAIAKAPHDKLFNYVKGVIHHGGAGTTAAGLYAGRPTFVVPQAVDQPFWGRRVYELGCGPKPVRLRKLTSDILAEALHDLDTNPAYEKAATALSRRLKAEDGTGRAIEVIEEVIARYRPLAKVRARRRNMRRQTRVSRALRRASQ